MSVGEHRCPYEVQGHTTDQERFGKKAHRRTLPIRLRWQDTISVPRFGARTQPRHFAEGLFTRVRGRDQPVEKLPLCTLSPQIRHQIRRFWGVSSPISGRHQLNADFFNRPRGSRKSISKILHSSARIEAKK
jgi:hypothetical protein